MRLWITGVPAVGKTTFCQWLRDEHGYTICFDPGVPGVPIPDLNGFLRASATHTHVVVDWGIPVSWIGSAGDLMKAYGLEAWWFEGDRVLAKRNFDARRARGEHIASEADHARYMNGISQEWTKYAALFGDRTMVTLSSEGVYLPVEQIMATIEAHYR